MNTLIQHVCTDFLECPTGMHEGGVTDSGYKLRNYSLFTLSRIRKSDGIKEQTLVFIALTRLTWKITRAIYTR